MDIIPVVVAIIRPINTTIESRNTNGQRNTVHSTGDKKARNCQTIQSDAYMWEDNLEASHVRLSATTKTPT